MTRPEHGTERVTVAGAQRDICVHRVGTGEALTLLHGFPGSSQEWNGVTPILADRFSMLIPDLLGYGASEKPAKAEITVNDQADLVAEMWKRHSIRSTCLVAYDVGGMVAMELLARQAESRLATRLDRVVLLNTPLFADTYRPRRITRLMAGGPLAPLARRALNERSVTASWSATFSPEHPLSPEQARATWERLSAGDDGARIGRLLGFVRERHTNSHRWDHALTTHPLRLLWGRADPISGSDADLIAERLPNAQPHVLTDFGHAPHLEDPDAIGQLLAQALIAAP